MAKKTTRLIMMIPEGESRDSHTYHFMKNKPKKMQQEGRTFRMRKWNPAKRKREWFVETRMPPHSKN